MSESGPQVPLLHFALTNGLCSEVLATGGDLSVDTTPSIRLSPLPKAPLPSLLDFDKINIGIGVWSGKCRIAAPRFGPSFVQDVCVMFRQSSECTITGSTGLMFLILSRTEPYP